jgi:hypothetical protein
VKIVKAKVLVDHIVRFNLDNGTYVDRDFSMLSGEVFDSIWKDPKKFKKVRVIGGCPTWPNDVDFCPDAVLWGRFGKKQPARFALIGRGGSLHSGRGVKQLTIR